MLNNGLPDSSLFYCILLLCLPHCLPAQMTCTICSSSFYALCTMSIHSTDPLLFNSTAALSSFFTHESPSSTTITATSNNNNNNPLLFSVLCIYTFCAPCACNVRNSSACWLCFVILHLSSALSDHHRDSSASLAVFPCVQHHWMLCWDSSSYLAVETLRLLCDSQSHLLCFSYRPQCPSIC